MEMDQTLMNPMMMQMQNIPEMNMMNMNPMQMQMKMNQEMNMMNMNLMQMQMKMNQEMNMMNMNQMNDENKSNMMMMNMMNMMNQMNLMNGPGINGEYERFGHNNCAYYNIIHQNPLKEKILSRAQKNLSLFFNGITNFHKNMNYYGSKIFINYYNLEKIEMYLDLDLKIKDLISIIFAYKKRTNYSIYSI